MCRKMNVCVFPLLKKDRNAKLCAIVKLIFTILLSYPLAGILKRLPDAQPAKKNLFMIGYVISH